MRWALTFGVALAAGAVMALELDPLLERFPADPPEAVVDIYALFNEAPEEAVRGLVGRYRSDTNSAVHYALDGWTTFVLRPEAKADERTALAAALARSIGETEEPEAMRFLLEQIGKVGVRESIEPLGQLLGDSEWAQAASLALQSFALPAWREEVAAVARPCLESADGRHRDVLLQLTEAQGEREHSVEMCRARLGDEADHVVCDSLVCLHDLLGDDAFPELSAALDHPAPAVRAVALALLGECRSEQVTDWFRRRLDHDDPQVRADALTLLIRRKDHESLDRALSLMADEHAVVRRAAFPAVLADQLFAAYPAADEADRPALLRAMLQHRDFAVADRAHALLQTSPDPQVQAAMLDLIGRCMARQYVPDVLAAVRSDNPALAKQAVGVLKQMAGAEDADALLDVMAQPAIAKSVRSGLVPALVAALNEAPDEEQRIAPVRDRISESDSELRQMLHRALGGLRASGAVTLLQEDTAHPEAEVRDSAVQYLCKRDGFEVTESLQAVAQATTNETHNSMVLRRLVQLVKKHQSADAKNVERRVEAGRRLGAARTVALREEEKAMILEALNGLDPEPEE